MNTMANLPPAKNDIVKTALNVHYFGKNSPNLENPFHFLQGSRIKRLLD